jgi:glycosyltransferase involved in cell wall biosynthesis
MNAPLVSVFVPTYNHAAFIRAAVMSAVEQDYPNLQVVVGDDGSTDGTAQIVAELAARHPDRMTAILGEHVGLPRNCNRILDACRGEYVAFFSGDDLFLPGKIRRQVEWLEADPRRLICGHDIDVFDSETGRVVFRWSAYFPLPKRGSGARHIVRNGYAFPGQSIMARASVVARNRYDVRLGLMCDWKFLIDLFATGDGYYGSIDGVLAKYRRHAASITLDDEASYGRLVEVLMTLGIVEAASPDLIGDTRHYRARVFLKLGGRRLAAGDRRGGRGYLLAALRSSPLASWKIPAALALTLLPGAMPQRVLSRYVTPTKI